MRIREYREEDEAGVVDLWRACGLVVPQNDPYRDIRRKLEVDRELFLIGTEGGRVVAAVMGGYDGHRGWINYLGVHPDCRRRGYAREVMAAVEARIRARGCAKINLQVRTGNEEVVAFYTALGYRHDPVLSLGKRLVEDWGWDDGER